MEFSVHIFMSYIKIRNLDSASDAEITGSNYIPTALEGSSLSTRKVTFDQVISGGAPNYSGNFIYGSFTGGLSAIGDIKFTGDTFFDGNPSIAGSLNVTSTVSANAGIFQILASDSMTAETAVIQSILNFDDLMNGYSQGLSEATEGEPDTVFDSEGNEVQNPNKNASSTVRYVDTDGDGIADSQVLVNTTPVTAENLDSLVQPGGGLEVTEVCQNETFDIVECEQNGIPNPDVKYKTKKLSLATSAASNTIVIEIHDTDGVEYRSGISVGIDGKLTAKLKRLRDAFTYIRNDVASSDAIINIYLQTDTDEGEIENSNGVFASHANLEINKCYINIYGDSAKYWTGGLTKVKMKAKRDPAANAYVPMWFNSKNILFSLVNLAFDLDDSGGVHSVIRSHNSCTLNLIGCKINARGSTHCLIEASRGATVQVQNYNDASTLLDPLNKGFWAPALELDFGPRKATSSTAVGNVGDDFYCDYLFQADTGGVIRFPEYGPHIPFNSNPRTYFQSRIHFCSSRIKVGSSVLSLLSNCVVDIIGLFTAANGLSFTSDNFPFFLRASAFNAVATRNGSHMVGATQDGLAEIANYIPGNALAAPTTQLGGSTVQGQDYVMANNITPTLNLLTTYKGRDALGNDTSGNIENYWDDFDWDAF